MDVKKRRPFQSGFSRAPILGSDGNPRIVFMRDLTPVDIGILKVLARYRTLSASHIAALIGATYIHVCSRIKLLKSPGNDYLKLIDIQQAHPNRYRNTPHYIELAPAGIAALRELCGITPPRYGKSIEWLEHKTMECETLASFEIGCIEHADKLAYIDRDTILSNPQTPEKTRTSLSPETMFLPGKTEDGKRKRIRPDGTFFVLKLLDPAGFCFFPGIEAETGKNPEGRVEIKLRNYLTILENEIYKAHFGARSFFVPFVFATTFKMERAMEQWEEVSAKFPKHRSHVLFKKTVTFETGRPEATGHMISGDWQRVGKSPLNFLKQQF